MKASEKSDSMRAGVFVLVGIGVFVLVVFSIGQKSGLFTRTDTLYVRFRDVNRLSVGSPVRLSGLEIGSVEAVDFPENLREKSAIIKLAVRSAYMERIRADSRATIDSSGLLGDKIINISVGDPSLPVLHDGATLKAGDAVTFEALADTLHDAIGAVKGVAQKAELVLGQTQDSEVKADIKRITSSLANVLGEVESGPGTLHRLIYDPGYAESLDVTLTEVRRLALRTRSAMGRVDRVLAEVERGNGGLHQLVYGQTAQEAVAEFALAARAFSDVLREVREGEGLAHTLIYDGDEGNFLKELDASAATLNRLLGEIDRGRGTLGGLIKDPTVYEDLKTTIGKIERNILFKALIRATIESEGLRRAERAPRVEAQATE